MRGWGGVGEGREGLKVGEVGGVVGRGGEEWVLDGLCHRGGGGEGREGGLYAL